MPVDTAITVWVRYLDGSGQPKPNEVIHADVSGYASVYPADLPPTDENGYSTTQITFSKPGTLGTIASYDASLTVTAKNDSSDTDNTGLHASTTVGGPLVITLDDTVNSADPNSAVITGGVWTLISGYCAQADGTPAAYRGVSWEVSDPSGALQPILANATTFTDDRGLFSNFVLTSYLAFGNLTVTLRSTQSSSSKTYACVAGPAPFGTIDLTNISSNYGWLNPIVNQLQATYTRADHASPGNKAVNWFSAPDDVHYDNSLTTTNGSGISTNIVRPGTQPNASTYTEAMWVEITDNGRRTRGALVQPVMDTMSSPNWGKLTPSSQDNNEFIPGVWHEIDVNFVDGNGNPFVDHPITWSATPADRFVFSQPYPTMTDVNGNAKIHVMAVGTETVGYRQAYITASGYDHINGVTFNSNYFGSIGSQPCPITITSKDDATQLSLYNPHQLTATYHAADNQQKPISWVVVPDSSTDTHHFVFEPNPSQTNSSGQATTQLTAYGPNVGTQVVAYARTYNQTTGEYDLSCPFPLSFVQGANPPADEGIIDVESIDGSPLSEGDWHLLTATYTTFDGTPLSNQPITWQVDPANTGNVQLLSTLPTLTDVEGVATNAVSAINTNNPFNATITATATNPFNAQETDEGDLTLTFQAQVQQSGCMHLTSDDEPPLSIGHPHDFSVHYYEGDCQTAVPDNTPVYWTAFPANRISFYEPVTYTTGGFTSNTAVASKGADINNAKIEAWSPNIQTGINDYDELTTRFVTPITQNLLGVMLDKTYAKNPARGQDIKPGDPTQVVKCQVQVLGQQGAQQITLLTNPATAPETMFKADGSGDELDNVNGNYVLTTDSNGVGTFLVGSENPTMFDLNAQWKTQTLPIPSKLVLATNSPPLSCVLPTPTVTGVANNGTLNIPPSPAPTFKVGLPPSRYATNGSQVALLLNNRLVYDGLADPALEGGVDVAYAALNLTGTNALMWVTPALKSCQLTFRTNGTPQLGPDTGGAARVLNAPVVDMPDGATIEAKDIINGGLQVDLYPYSAMKPNEDVITMYFYLSGQDVLMSQLTPPQLKQVYNIVPVIYPLPSNSPLLAGQSVTLTLPQQYAAGYIPTKDTNAFSQVQVDYKVVNPTNGTRWSKLSKTYPLNTTF
ncbi:hypothetical protein [Pseudorhodoplanes sinuspersici]|uniref:hypothetical protein n=1 Tax=Pseudorhodoplanes sinuspersici TaxID=1235591 RepID=UPI0012FD2549|nr:hypothetical protein [Pseudorhodoplanes sinuspersici]